jgi:spore coat polysaccharide biosynthesis predicted glycosyltransferase SpsG
MRTTGYFYIDSGPRSGLGHVARCEAIAEVFAEAGVEIVLSRPLEVPHWAPPAFPVLLGSRVSMTCDSTGPRHMHVYDSYSGDAKVHLQELACTGLAIWLQDTSEQIDGADILINPNVGVPPLPQGDDGGEFKIGRAEWLRGGLYTPIRKKVRLASMAEGRQQPVSSPSRILVSTGGATPTESLQYITRMLSELPLTAIVVVPEHAENHLERSGRARIQMVPPSPNLIDLLKPGDVALLTSGTTIWDMFMNSVPVAVTTTSETQRSTVDRLQSLRLVTDLGSLFSWDGSGMEALKDLCFEDGRREAQALRARQSLDGLGAFRIARKAQEMLAMGPCRRRPTS